MLGHPPENVRSRLRLGLHHPHMHPQRRSRCLLASGLLDGDINERIFVASFTPGHEAHQRVEPYLHSPTPLLVLALLFHIGNAAPDCHWQAKPASGAPGLLAIAKAHAAALRWRFLLLLFPAPVAGRVCACLVQSRRDELTNVCLYKESRRSFADHPSTSGNNSLIPRCACMSLDEICFERCPSVLVLCKGLPWDEMCAARVADLLEWVFPTSTWSSHPMLIKS